MTLDNYPSMLKAEHISEILGVSLRYAYELMNQKGFPLVQFGRTKRVQKEDLVKWIEQHKVR